MNSFRRLLALALAKKWMDEAAWWNKRGVRTRVSRAVRLANMMLDVAEMENDS